MTLNQSYLKSPQLILAIFLFALIDGADNAAAPDQNEQDDRVDINMFLLLDLVSIALNGNLNLEEISEGVSIVPIAANIKPMMLDAEHDSLGYFTDAYVTGLQ